VAHDFGGYWTVFQCLYIGLAHLVVAKSALFEKKCDDMLIRLSVFVLVAIAISSLIGGMIWAFYGLFIPLFISGLYSLCLYVAAKKALSIKPVT
jgi:hypothetical protein